MSNKQAVVILASLFCMIALMGAILTGMIVFQKEAREIAHAVKTEVSKIRVSVESTEEGFSVEVTNQEPTLGDKIEETFDSLADIWSDAKRKK